MGKQQSDSISANMNTFVVFSTIVAALADPQVVYGGAGLKSAPCVNAFNVPVPYNAGYAGVYGAGYYGKRDADAQFVGLKSAPCVNAFNVPVPCNAGYVGVYGVGYYGKRDADAQFLNSGVYGAYGYTAPHGVAATPFGLTHSSNVVICHNFVGAQVPCYITIKTHPL